jgi:hypothetical protein
MQTLGSILSVIGMLTVFGGAIWLLVVAFQESVGWGIACLLVPCASLYFVFTHWEESRAPFLIQIGGGALMGISGVLLGGGAHS